MQMVEQAAVMVRREIALQKTGKYQSFSALLQLCVPVWFARLYHRYEACPAINALGAAAQFPV